MILAFRTAFATALTALLLGAPAQAQSSDEAVRANVWLATSLCADAMIGGAPPSSLFGPAGFVYRGVDRGVNDFGIARGTGHYFDAPVGTAKAEVLDPNGRTGLCYVSTTHLAEAEFASLVAGAVFQKYPNTRTSSPTQWSIPTASGLSLIVSVTTIGNNNRYEAPGTVRVSMSFPG